jgi:hypothetical protein
VPREKLSCHRTQIEYRAALTMPLQKIGDRGCTRWGWVHLVETLRLRREQKTLSSVIGERAIAVGTGFSRPRQWWLVPVC